MGSVILAAVAGAVAALLLVAVVHALTRHRRNRRDLEALLAAAQRESDDLRLRLEELAARVESRPTGSELAAPADFVITSAGEHATDDDQPEPIRVPDRVVLSATVGVPLVKVVAFSHGVRRALAAESRNRIRFEVKREVRASRRRRRQLRRTLERDYRARLRATEEPA